MKQEMAEQNFQKKRILLELLYPYVNEYKILKYMKLNAKVSWSTCVADGKRLISTNKKGRPNNKDRNSLEYKILRDRRKQDYIVSRIENGLL